MRRMPANRRPDRNMKALFSLGAHLGSVLRLCMADAIDLNIGRSGGGTFPPGTRERGGGGRVKPIPGSVYNFLILP